MLLDLSRCIPKLAEIIFHSVFLLPYKRSFHIYVVEVLCVREKSYNIIYTNFMLYDGEREVFVHVFANFEIFGLGILVFGTLV